MRAYQELIWGVLLALAVVASGFLLDLELYAPERGRVAAGQPSEASEIVPRDTATVTVEERMSPDPERPPTLREIVAFFALEEDTLHCSLNENALLPVAEDRVAELADRPRELGEEIVLCLD